MINSITTSLSGLQASSLKLNASASNIANASSIGSLEEGGHQAYTPVDVVQTSGGGGTVEATLVARDPASITSFAPGSPFANSQGLVAAPNVNLDEEIINTLEAEHNYKASAAALATAQELSETLLNTFDEDA